MLQHLYTQGQYLHIRVPRTQMCILQRRHNVDIIKRRNYFEYVCVSWYTNCPVFVANYYCIDVCNCIKEIRRCNRSITTISLKLYILFRMLVTMSSYRHSSERIGFAVIIEYRTYSSTVIIVVYIFESHL